MNMENRERGELTEQERQSALDNLYAARNHFKRLLTQQKILGGVVDRPKGQKEEDAISEAEDQYTEANDNCLALGITDKELIADHHEREENVKKEALDELAESAKAVGITSEESVARPPHFKWGESPEKDRFKKAWQLCTSLGMNYEEMDKGWKSRN